MLSEFQVHVACLIVRYNAVRFSNAPLERVESAPCRSKHIIRDSYTNGSIDADKSQMELLPAPLAVASELDP